MTRYAVRVSRDGRFWLVRLPQVRRSTQARTLREVDTMARDLIAIMTGSPPESIELDVEVQLPDSVRAHLRRAQRLRHDAATAQAQAAAEARAAAKELAKTGLTMRDIGQALGISYQRAHQLVAS